MGRQLTGNLDSSEFRSLNDIKYLAMLKCRLDKLPSTCHSDDLNLVGLLSINKASALVRAKNS